MSSVFINLTIGSTLERYYAFWLVPKFGKKEFSELIRFAYTFCIYSWLALLKTVTMFRLDAKPCELFMCARIITQKAALHYSYNNQAFRVRIFVYAKAAVNVKIAEKAAMYKIER
jgi:hypothetical protein